MNPNKKENRFLHIQLKKNMIDLLQDYCKKTGMEEIDLGHIMGYLNALIKDDTNVLATLNQLFFYAGVYSIKECKKEIKYEYKSKTQVQTFKQELKKNTPLYMG